MVTVSVIIPTYNYAHYICFAIESVLEQAFDGIVEIIIVDDGSTDNTALVVKKYVAEQKVIYHYQKNKGKAAATNFAIQQCTGEYIFNLDADDLFLPNKIAHTIAIFKTDNSIVHVASPAKIFNQHDGTFTIENIPDGIIGRAIDGSWLLQYFYNLNILFGGGTTYAAKAEILKKIVIPAAVDMYIDEFLIVSILPFGKCYFMQEALSIWRVHQNNYSIGITTINQKRHKENRLLNSSDALLYYLQKNNFAKKFVKLYTLKNATAHITLQENENKKNLKDIFNYAFKTFFILRPTWVQIKNYHVINRLIPLGLFNFLKAHLKRI